MSEPPPVDPAVDRKNPRETAAVFADLGRRLSATADTAAALRALTDLTADVVAGVRWVSVTRGRHDRFTTTASSDPVATHADRVQYDLGAGLEMYGDHVDAFDGDSAYLATLLATARRLPSPRSCTARGPGTCARRWIPVARSASRWASS